MKSHSIQAKGGLQEVEVNQVDGMKWSQVNKVTHVALEEGGVFKHS